LSSLSKAILLQAETEVTAEKKSAIPLSIVTAHLLQRLPGFDEILWAKLIQRTGGWAVPIAIPKDADGDGTPWENDAQRRKVMGYRNEEGESEYVTRIAGIMRVYFMTMWAPVEIDQPLEKLYQTPRFWMWFSRVLRSFDGELVETAAGAEVIAGALHSLVQIIYDANLTCLIACSCVGGWRQSCESRLGSPMG
jgi:nucleoporin GLE1